MMLFNVLNEKGVILNSKNNENTDFTNSIIKYNNDKKEIMNYMKIGIFICIYQKIKFG